VCVAIAAGHGLRLWHGLRLGHGLCLRQRGVRAFALGYEAGLGVIEYAAVGEGLWCLTCDLAADGGIFAGTNLGLCRRDGPQAQGDQGAAEKDAKACLFFHAQTEGSVVGKFTKTGCFGAVPLDSFVSTCKR